MVGKSIKILACICTFVATACTGMFYCPVAYAEKEIFYVDEMHAQPPANRADFIFEMFNKYDENLYGEKVVDFSRKGLDHYLNIGDGLRAMKRHDYQAAESYWNEAIRLKPKKMKPYLYKLGLYALLNDRQKEIQCYDAIIKINPTAGYLMKGKAYQEWGENVNALACYDRLTKKKSTGYHGDGYLEKGKIYYEMGDYKNAAINCLKADEFGNSDIAGYLDGSLSYLKLGYAKSAAAILDNIVIEKRESNIISDFYISYQSQGETSFSGLLEALDKGNSVLRGYVTYWINASSIAEFHMLKGQIAIELGDIKKATENIKKAVAYDNRSVDASPKLYTGFGKSESYADMIAAYERLIPVDQGLAHHCIGMVYLVQGDDTNAMRQFDQVITHGQEVQGNHDKAMVSLMLKNYGAAENYFQKAIDLDQSDEKTETSVDVYNRAHSRYLLGDYQRALEGFVWSTGAGSSRKLSLARSDVAKMHLLRGTLHGLVGNTKEAESEFIDAVRLEYNYINKIPKEYRQQVYTIAIERR